jgi:hypothetical protein
MPEETALIGWNEIARYLGWTKSKTLSRRQELKKYGIIFHTLVGKPPNRRKRVFYFSQFAPPVANNKNLKWRNYLNEII